MYTIPNGIQLDELPPTAWPNRSVDIVIGGLKQPDWAREVAASLEREGFAVRMLIDRVGRERYLRALRDARVALLLPNRTEGFFLPALETMAMDVLTVCPDCMGNRDFCIDGSTALMPEWNTEAIVEAADRALRLPEEKTPTASPAGQGDGAAALPRQ